MTRKTTILIRENGQPLNTKTADEKQGEKKKINHTEQAATLQEPEETSNLELVSPVKEDRPNKKFGFRILKPILVAVSSAVIIGSILGFIMLRMFGGIETEAPGQIANPVTGVSENTADEQSGKQAITLEAMNTFVLQGGVFSKQQNAEEWANIFSEAGMPTMMWERDGQVFLLAGPTNTKEQGNEVADQFSELDIYVKEWSVPSSELAVSAKEEEWLKSFQEQWQHSLMTIEENGTLQEDDWEGVKKQAPTNNDQFSTLVEAVNSINQSEGLKARQQLLQLLYAYEQAIN